MTGSKSVLRRKNKIWRSTMSKNQASTAGEGIDKYFFRASAEDFKKIPGSPIAYWLSKRVLSAFSAYKLLGDQVPVRGGMTTANNERFVRYWHEVDFQSFHHPEKNNGDWCPYNKGGEYRKWYGNRLWVVFWGKHGEEIKSTGRASVRSEEFYRDEMIGWTDITSYSQLGVRYYGNGFLFDASGPSVFPTMENKFQPLLGYLGSKISSLILSAINPTLHVQAGNISSLPWIDLDSETYDAEKNCVSSLVKHAKKDWNSYEISWDFTNLPLLHSDYRHPTLKASYQDLRTHWREMTQEMLRLEEENNHIFIDAYGLKDELDEDVDLSEITLTCNPHYRYGGDKSEEELEAMLLADTMRELVSYAVGCMFGRYSMDKPGLILSSQGETLADYLRQVPQPSFPADDDNVIPLLDGDWFPDDITLRFRQFLRVAFGDAYYEDNLAFIEQGLNVKGKRNYGLRDYFLGEFYTDHVKRYKKRPIYWLFSSPKGTFNALVYLHRYRPDTVSVVLNYLRDFSKKLASRLDYLQQVAISPSASQGDKTKANKEAETIKKQLLELDDYERDTLYPLATKQKSLDLDAGVKANYLELGAALKKIPGLEAKGED
ncbi:BREX-1 system adenine-specific DNA-methyltransferase PglX [Pseudomonas helleri]|uniref:site-specific DNA-methyltransferase (adenine-specific) n=2 Tax=Pseudomonas helleri TaxID=1608996 RepID=A0A6A7YWG1_9PSED|nr:BREX-1 system adenine-specific DNA-methyltransferase PglX [Pseudomonas helleri]